MTHDMFSIEKVHKIFYYERLEEDWTEIAKFAGFRFVPKLRHYRKSESNIVLATFTEAERQLILSYYKRDFDHFGYEAREFGTRAPGNQE